ncbi:L-histidine N(alpha)-methyltransferase [Permianibacter sp. IMCC34836]|uniref:L-histidine N(alpha)-methyltransferase n=1 Tax=Permianibacter fluminis TaxID=2738515 RepID=UPI001553E843|nr:L-histidine N(alpha)-methyltransferase [Permianibacter fluminis]NQD35886.1 L-histidine N(alpha)-methyltransferase [Permianibacter fluminis]
MKTTTLHKRDRLDQLDRHTDPRLAEIVAGLQATPKRLSPKYFYDAVGSKLFDRICHLPEYYPTRTEVDILSRQRQAIAKVLGTGMELIEFGSGSSIKIRLLLQTLRPENYLPVDISAQHLHESARKLKADYPWLKLTPICLDYSQPFSLPVSRQQRIGFFPGSSIGNFEPADAEQFLRQVATLLGSGNGLLIGVDTPKDETILNAAYNDGDGVTAAFNLNILQHINALTGSKFDTARFAHQAFYNADAGRIEMHLRSVTEQRVAIAGEWIHLAAGETIHTENSYKYSRSAFLALAERAGYEPVQTWADDRDWFNVHYLRVR